MSRTRSSPEPLATFWVQATAGVNYYRAELPARYLPGKCVLLEERDLVSLGGSQFTFPQQEGAAVWMFPGNTTRALLMAEMQEEGIPVFVEVDDNYLIASVTPGISQWERRIDLKRDHSAFETHRRIVPWADGVIVSTPKLAEVYSKLHRNIHVCPNSIDPADWPSEVPHQPDGILRVGWAGSWSHQYDVQDIRRALDWAARQPDVEVVLMGYDPGWMLPYRHVTWSDSLADYRQAVSQIDVMLCPVRPGPWSDCKSDVKALEGAMGGAVPVVGMTEPYRPWWAGDGAPCFVLADGVTAKDWFKVVKYVVSHREDVRQVALEAREYVLRERTIQANVHHWQEAISSAPAAPVSGRPRSAA